MKNEKGDYIPPDDVERLAKGFSIMSEKFSLALLRSRSKKMDEETFDRCIRTMQSLKGKSYFR
tara:strand:- start:84 stop:272 length:189 start_codon:yes stop_codon:yes gene_type:complete